MDVVLIQPPRLSGLKETRSSIPLSLLYLASALRSKKHTPYIIDLSIEKLPDVEKVCKEKIKKIRAKLIGINCFTTMHFPTVVSIAKLIKKQTHPQKFA